MSERHRHQVERLKQGVRYWRNVARLRGRYVARLEDLVDRFCRSSLGVLGARNVRELNRAAGQGKRTVDRLKRLRTKRLL